MASREQSFLGIVLPLVPSSGSEGACTSQSEALQKNTMARKLKLLDSVVPKRRQKLQIVEFWLLIQK